MYAAVSGLRTHMNALNVIGQNISNVNTNAYKATRYTFAEALYTSVHSGSNGTEVLGGRNPAQIGYGCSLATVDLDMSTKNYVPTGNLLDVMIDGDGFIMVGDKTKEGVNTQEELQGMNLTRHGDLSFVNGYLVDGQGQVVYGFLTQRNGTGAADDPYTYDAIPVLTPIRLPMCTTTTGADGKAKKEYFFHKPDGTAPNQKVITTATEDQQKTAEWGVFSNVSIEESGRIVGTCDDVQYILGYVALAKVDNPNGVTHVDGRYFQAMGGAGDVHLCTAGAVVTNVAGGTGTTAPGGGGTTATPGPLDIVSADKTTFINGGLESSGTDLANEISNMIIIQRGYQANTRIVTVTDSMLEELVNMKRG